MSLEVYRIILEAKYTYFFTKKRAFNRKIYIIFSNLLDRINTSLAKDQKKSTIRPPT